MKIQTDTRFNIIIFINQWYTIFSQTAFHNFQQNWRYTRSKNEKKKEPVQPLYGSNRRSWKNRQFICTRVARIVIVKCEQRFDVSSYKSRAPFAVKNHMAVDEQMFTSLCTCIGCQFCDAWNRFRNGLTHFNLCCLYYSYYNSLLQSRIKMNIAFMLRLSRHAFHFFCCTPKCWIFLY